MFYQLKFIYRFKSRDIDKFGEFVTSINGMESDPAALTAWVPFLFSGGQLAEGNKIFFLVWDRAVFIALWAPGQVLLKCA